MIIKFASTRQLLSSILSANATHLDLCSSAVSISLLVDNVDRINELNYILIINCYVAGIVNKLCKLELIES